MYSTSIQVKDTKSDENVESFSQSLYAFTVYSYKYQNIFYNRNIHMYRGVTVLNISA